MKDTLEGLNPKYKYALLYTSSHKDTLYISVKLNIIESEVIKLYEAYKDELNDRDVRLSIIRELLSSGYALEDVSEAITWKDFEYLVSKYFEENGFNIKLNLRIRKPVREIDIIAVKGKIIFCIDCKHWNKILYPSIIEKIVSEQVNRCYILSRKHSYHKYDIYPLIISLRISREIFHNHVGIIPVNALKEFIDKYPYFIANKIVKNVNELIPH